MVVQVATIAEAETLLPERRWTGVIVGLRANGGGLAWLATLRERGDPLPALLVPKELDKTLASACHRLGARCAFAPLDAETAMLFSARAIVQRAERDQRIAAIVQKLAVERALSPREADVARLAAIGVSRAGLAASLGVTENTVKSYVRGLLRRTGAVSVDAVGRTVLEQVVLATAESGAAPSRPPRAPKGPTPEQPTRREPHP